MVRKSITCISLLFIGCGITYFGLDYHNQLTSLSTNELLVEKYFEKEKTNNKQNSNPRKNNYIAILEIPKIKFKRGLYKIDNPLSNIDKNIIFLDSSDMPNEKNSRVIIVGHSGATSNAYFKNLYKLKKSNNLLLYYDNIKYTYKITDIYEVVKNGTLALESNKDKKMLTLVTCKGNTKQLVIVATLTKQKKF